jgi:hypothetical protein
MPKVISNLIKGRGTKAPALLTPPKALLLVRLVRVSGGYCALEWRPVEATVIVVSLLTEALPAVCFRI